MAECSSGGVTCLFVWSFLIIISDNVSQLTKKTARSSANKGVGTFHCLHRDCKGKAAVTRQRNHKRHDGSPPNFDPCTGPDCTHCNGRVCKCLLSLHCSYLLHCSYSVHLCAHIRSTAHIHFTAHIRSTAHIHFTKNVNRL